VPALRGTAEVTETPAPAAAVDATATVLGAQNQPFRVAEKMHYRG
jgi:hypothetical protein